MASEGPNYPGTVSQSGAGQAWANTGNLGADDGSYCTCTRSSDGDSQTLLLTNFGFSIPSGATIDGVVAEIGRLSSHDGVSAYSRDSVVRLIVGGSATGDDKAATGTNWPTSEATASYGGASDLWGLTLADTDVTASTFGISVKATINRSLADVTASIDFVRITVYYTLASGWSGKVVGVASPAKVLGLLPGKVDGV